jgi:hypothetical protein
MHLSDVEKELIFNEVSDIISNENTRNLMIAEFVDFVKPELKEWALGVVERLKGL